MSKTEDVLKALNDGKDTKTIIAEIGASESLISRCRQKLRKQESENDEPEPTDEELDEIISQISIKPDEKYLTKDKQEQEEEYHCMGCDHRWRSSEMPLSCPKCGAEF